MLDANPARLVKLGAVTIDTGGVVVRDFGAAGGASCRDVAALAMLWAIGELQHELTALLQAPGCGRVAME